MDQVCRNCDTELRAEFAYCPACSQRTQLHRLSMHDVFHEAIHYFTHADRGLFVLLKDLATRTGAVAREYIDGKRKKHFPPLNFYLITAAILLFSYSFQSPQDMPATDLTEASVHQIRQANVSAFVKSNTDLIMIFALPFTALVYRVYFRRSGYNFTEHLVACMYMIGLMMLVYAVVIIPFFEWMGMPGWLASVALFTVKFVYQSVFYYRFLQKKRWTGALNTAFAAFLSLSLWALFTISLIALYVYNGFFGLAGD